MKSGINSEICKICGLHLAGSDNPCPACRTGIFFYDELKILGYWCGALREWVSMIKYGGDVRLTRWIALQLSKICQEYWPDIILVPVPPRRERIFRQGIDPVGIIAGKMKFAGIPVEFPLRRLGGSTQKSLGRTDRLKGISLNYELKNTKTHICGSRIILDDVSTTGATLNYCARILKNAGAERVYGLVICRD